MIPTFETLDFSLSDRVATITLNRPDNANGINPQMGKDLAAVAAYCDDQKELKVALLCAKGKMFCAGGDLKTFAEFGDEAALRIKTLADDLHRAVSIFSRMSPVFIVAVNGVAAGAGFSLAMAGDLVIACESAKFTMAYTAAGLSPDGGASYLLPRLIGLRATQELMLTNRRLSAVEAKELGLVTRVVSDDALPEEVDGLVKHMANTSATANGTVKQLLLSSFDNSLETQMELEARSIANSVRSQDGQEGIRAFIEKRKPNFQG